MTRECIERYCNADYEYILNLCASDVFWIGAFQGQYIFGIEEVAESLRLNTPKICNCQPISTEFTVALNNYNCCAVLARYLTFCEDNDGLPVNIRNRCTFLWENIYGNLLIKHVHNSVSVSGADLTGLKGSVEPSGTNSGKKHGDITFGYKIPVERLDGVTVFIPTADIIYACADNKRSVIVTVNGSVCAKISIGVFNDITDGNFVCVHRSFVINVNHIREIKRYRLIMSDKSYIPIPVKRYNEIAERLAGLHTALTVKQ